MRTYSEFHVGDPVMNTETGERFVVTGISRGAKGLLYCGENMGWTDEEQLDYDRTEAQKLAMAEAERPHATAVAALREFHQHILQLKLVFGMRPPPEVSDWIFMLMQEMEAIDQW